MTVEMATLELEATENLVENTLVSAIDGDEPVEEGAEDEESEAGDIDEAEEMDATEGDEEAAS